MFNLTAKLEPTQVLFKLGLHKATQSTNVFHNVFAPGMMFQVSIYSTVLDPQAKLANITSVPMVYGSYYLSKLGI